MKVVNGGFVVGYVAVGILFLATGALLVVFAGAELLGGVRLEETLPMRARLNAVLEAVGLLTIAVAALELGQTILEEEVLRRTHMSTPTRARRFLSRFMVVIVVALSIECLVAVFRLAHESPQALPQAATIGIAAGVLLAAWGVFVHLNVTAEAIEPEAMAQAKREDRELE